MPNQRFAGTRQPKHQRLEARLTNNFKSISTMANSEAKSPQPQLREMHKYDQNQQVCFVGGVGTVRGCRPGSCTWVYTVEMALGPEPEMGRIGYETVVLLQETEIQGILCHRSQVS